MTQVYVAQYSGLKQIEGGAWRPSKRLIGIDSSYDSARDMLKARLGLTPERDNTDWIGENHTTPAGSFNNRLDSLDPEWRIAHIWIEVWEVDGLCLQSV